jgi:hypothetical protein
MKRIVVQLMKKLNPLMTSGRALETVRTWEQRFGVIAAVTFAEEPILIFENGGIRIKFYESY